MAEPHRGSTVDMVDRIRDAEGGKTPRLRPSGFILSGPGEQEIEFPMSGGNVPLVEADEAAGWTAQPLYTLDEVRRVYDLLPKES